MFGSKLRTWMEAHIARAKHKKKDRNKKEEDNVDSTCNSPIASQRQNRSSSTSSSSIIRVHPTSAPLTSNAPTAGKVVKGIGPDTRITSTTGGCGNLSSPESAYSTGYSTDGTSPNGTFPPEYYINIRTGTHYFQNGSSSLSSSSGYSNSNSSSNNNNNNNNNNRNNNHSKIISHNKTNIGKSRISRQSPLEARSENGRITEEYTTTMDNDQTMHQQGRQHQYQYHQQYLQPSERNRAGGLPSAAAHCRTGKSYSVAEVPTLISPRPLILPSPPCTPSTQSPRQRSRIRTNPWLTANSSACNAPTTSTSVIPLAVAGSNPRAFNGNDTSSVDGSNITRSSSSSTNNIVNVNVSWRRDAGTVALDGKPMGYGYRQESLSAGRSPINSKWVVSARMELGRKQLSSTSSSSSSSSSSSDSVDSNSRRSASSVARRRSAGQRSSEDDITLNEMMGKFDESYVYEKETDILSDDTTDCEERMDSDGDYIHRGIPNNADEHNANNFDYIDNEEAILGLDNNIDAASHFRNIKQCTYFAFSGTSVQSRRRESEKKIEGSLMNGGSKNGATNNLNNNGGTIVLSRRRRKSKSRDEEETVRRSPGNQQIDTRRHAKRQVSARNHHKSRVKDKEEESEAAEEEEEEEEEAGEKLLKKIAQHNSNADLSRRSKALTANMNRILVERLLLKNLGFNQTAAAGSRSAGGTPTCLRRRRLQGVCDVKNRSSLSRLAIDDRETSQVTRPATPNRNETFKRRSNSISYAVQAETYGLDRHQRIFASELALIEADKEADRKYKQLILEAESILVNMQQEQPLQRNHCNSPVAPSPRRIQNCLTNKRVEHIKNTELNIEHALLKSRNTQPELASGSIKDLEHSSPKRQLARSIVSSASPIRGIRSDKYDERGSVDSRDFLSRDALFKQDLYDKLHSPYKTLLLSNNSNQRKEQNCGKMEDKDLKENDYEQMYSSSDSENRCYDKVKRETHLPTFRSIDMGPTRRIAAGGDEGDVVDDGKIREGYCPHSEPVKRKVYAGSVTYGRLQKTLGEQRVAWLRNSDGDTTNDQDFQFLNANSQSRRSLGEKGTFCRRLGRDANEEGGTRMSRSNQALSPLQLKRQMLVHTLQGLKQSLQDQSAVLKQTCLKPAMLS